MQLIGILLAALIPLNGAVGTDLRARAFFDANNVKVGDPLVLTIDFLGEADFKSLHPPALSRAVDRRDWKLDDASAKTDTFRDARRLTYRIRPMRPGVLWFPALEFSYTTAKGESRTVRANEIPVHAKAGAQVVVAEMGEDLNEMPRPAPLVTTPPSGLNDDGLFAWRKACANPTADAFAAFDAPAAKLNEARCAILDGNWARAQKVLQRLEWRTGQTPEIERNLRAALALKFDNPAVELPVWRQVGRPLLKYDWRGRVGLVVGAFAALALLFWLLGRGIRAVACLALAVGLVTPAAAQDIFEQFEQMHRRMQQQMQRMSSGFNISFGGEEEREPVKITARLAIDREAIQVGEPFRFVLSLEAPKTSSIGQIRMTPSENFGMTVTGRAENLADEPSKNPTNVIKRLSVPVRYDVPFKGTVSFRVEGMVTGRQTRNGGRFSFTFSNSFAGDTQALALDVKPLPTANQPADFAGVVSEGLRLFEYPDLTSPETNDVVTITYRMLPNGYVPPEFMPKGAAYEWSRQNDEEGHVRQIEYRRYFVADGAAATPRVKVPYYDPRTKSYKTAEAGGTPLTYRPPAAH